MPPRSPNLFGFGCTVSSPKTLSASPCSCAPISSFTPTFAACDEDEGAGLSGELRYGVECRGGELVCNGVDCEEDEPDAKLASVSYGAARRNFLQSHPTDLGLEHQRHDRPSTGNDRFEELGEANGPTSSMKGVLLRADFISPW